MVHGDDFIAVGPDQHLAETRRTLEDRYKLKVQVLGREEGKDSELRILNKVVRWTNAGIELEADPRHAEIIVATTTRSKEGRFPLRDRSYKVSSDDLGAVVEDAAQREEGRQATADRGDVTPPLEERLDVAPPLEERVDVTPLLEERVDVAPPLEEREDVATTMEVEGGARPPR